jgi:Zn-dependent protease with chaperone function
MNNHPQKSHQSRLDPFVFPSETTLRFALLIVSVISASLFIYNRFYWGYRITQIDVESFVNLAGACFSQANAGSTSIFSDPRILILGEKTNEAAQAAKTIRNTVRECLEPHTKEVLNAALFSVGGVGILVSLASLLYSLFPVLMIRKEGLMSLENQADMEDIVVYLQSLCQEIGIRPPKFLQKPLDRAIGGRAFGALGQYYVVLPIGLLILFDQDRDKFRAVMLHELSHLRNQDVDKIYFSVAMGFAFVIVALLPFVLFLWSFSSSYSYLFQVLWRVIALTLLVYLTFTSVVRSRELYADVRASTYPGSEVLGSLFWDAPRSKFSGLQSSIISTLEKLPYFKRNRWQFAFLLHPDVSERRQVLETTDRLFNLDVWAAFTTGITLIIAYNPVSILFDAPIRYFSKYDDVFLLVFLIKGFIFSSLIVGILGVGVWRRTFVTLIRHQDSAEAGKVGLALSVGMILGKVFSLGNARSSLEVIRIAGYPLEANLAITLFGDFLLLVSFYYFFRWMAVGALIWLRASISAHSPRPFYTVGILVVGFCLTCLLGVIFGIWDVAKAIPNRFETLLAYIVFLPMLIINFAVYPLTLIASVSLWAFPLSARAWHKRQPDSTFLPRWGFLDQMPSQIHQPTRCQLEIHPALRVGLMGGLIYGGLLFALRLGLYTFLPKSITDSASYNTILLFGCYVGLATLIQLGVAIKVARKVQSFHKVHGLLAAFTAGCVMTLTALILSALFGRKIDAEFIWRIFSLIVNCGAMLSLLGMIMVRLQKNRETVVT